METVFSVYKCVQLELKADSNPSEMSGFMIMWLNKDEGNPCSQMI